MPVRGQAGERPRPARGQAGIGPCPRDAMPARDHAGEGPCQKEALLAIGHAGNGWAMAVKTHLYRIFFLAGLLSLLN